MTDPTASPDHPARDVVVYFIGACAITWLLDLPLVVAWLGHATPAPYAIALAGLGALGPSLAALALALRRGSVRDVFGRWRTSPLWIVGGLLLAPAIHLPATLIEVALGGQPGQWFYPPLQPEHIAALVMFSFGEEFGWRGFAYPRLVNKFGPALGCLLLGAGWGIWHLGMMVTPDGPPDWPHVLYVVTELALYSVVIGWLFEKSNRSMAVAIAIHMSGHLDNVNRAPATEVRLQIIRLIVVAIAAVLAARALHRRTQLR
jgi:uncharacterized protein